MKYAIGQNIFKKTRINKKIFKTPPALKAEKQAKKISQKVNDKTLDAFYGRLIAEENYNRAMFHLTNLPVSVN